MKPLLAIFAQQVYKRRIQRVLQGLVGRHCAPILTTVVLRREARKAHWNVGQDHLRQKCSFIKHGSEEEWFQYATRRALCLHHVDHSGIFCIAVVAHVCDDFIIQIINHINRRIVDVVHHIGLMMTVHDVQHRTLQVKINSGSDMLSVMLSVLVAKVMISQHRHIERAVRDVLHHSQLGIFIG